MSRIVYGINPVLELLKAGKDNVDELVVAKGRNTNRLQEILDMAKALGAKIRYRNREDLSELAGTSSHQGILVKVGEFTYTALDDYLNQTDHSLVVILDGIQDPHNLGAIARTALAAGTDALIIPKDRAVGVTGTAIKVSSGALERLPVIKVTNLNQTAIKLQDNGFWILGTTVDAPQSLYSLPDLPSPLAVIIGAEGKGVSKALTKKCDFLANLPMANEMGSLNASAAAAVVLFELVRRGLGD